MRTEELLKETDNALKVIGIILILIVLVGFFQIPKYQDEANRLAHPELNCQPGWVYVETTAAELCVKPHQSYLMMTVETTSVVLDSTGEGDVIEVQIAPLDN